LVDNNDANKNKNMNLGGCMKGMDFFVVWVPKQPHRHLNQAEQKAQRGAVVADEGELLE
jgi:hypothetical protein